MCTTKEELYTHNYSLANLSFYRGWQAFSQLIIVLDAYKIGKAYGGRVWNFTLI